MPASAELNRLRRWLDRADDALSNTTWNEERSPELRQVIDEARLLADGSSELIADPVGSAVADAESAVARAVLAQDASVAARPGAGLRTVAAEAGDVVARLPQRVWSEVRHILFGKPHSVLWRLVMTMAISLGWVTAYEVTGWTSFDGKTLTLYVFSAVIGSVVCTNALCFDAARVRQELNERIPLWRILVIKNLAMGLLIGVAATPVIIWLAVHGEVGVPVMIDQLAAMLFIWFGVANVLSVVAPLRREPLTHRLHDGTWLPYLASFAISYGVGLTVNVMIYWRLWARQAASDEIVGGAWSAFFLVLTSSMLSWMLLTVVAVGLARNPVLRGIVARELRSGTY
ncbi:MAG: hypothetical protein QM658_10530 [Gordonia sp. (in: high G+C Gram-positive bacteria)]